jgi:heme-degrading monooxygenase HmoA
LKGCDLAVILEVVEVDAVQGAEAAFEDAYRAASSLLQRAEGFISMQLIRGIEVPNRYRVLIQWQNLESHTREFRESQDYQAFVELTRPHAVSRAVVQHYELVMQG